MVCLSFVSVGQDTLKVTPTGMSNSKQSFKILFDEGILLKRSEKWVNTTYANPDKVVSGFKTDNTLNKHFKVNGYSSSVSNLDGQHLAVKYTIDISIEDSLVTINFNIIEMKIHGTEAYLKFTSDFSSVGFYKKNGQFNGGLLQASKDLELFVSNLVFSYYNALLDNSMTSDEALAELKKAKEKLDLGLITQEKYDEIKAELLKYIN